MERAKVLFNALPENEKLALVEKVMPVSGTYRQLEESGNWSDGQWRMLHDKFIDSISWEKGAEMDEVSFHDKSFVINGKSELGNEYEGIGIFCDDNLLFIEDLEFKTKS